MHDAEHGRARLPALAPPLKWAGGKRWQVPLLEPLWNAHRSARLVEPFCGGLGVTLGLLPDRALLNDVNPHLINFYNWVRRGLVLDLAMENDRDQYYSHRDRFNALLRDGGHNGRDAAALFYFLNRTGYNGLCRFNSRDQFNVPFGDYRRIAYTHDFRHYRATFRQWTFTSGDFERVPLRPDDFVYADPPYDVQFTRYSRAAFGWDDQVRLAEWLIRHPGAVVLVNQATERITRLYLDLGYSLRFVDAPRRINCTGDRTPAREVIATRNCQPPD